MVSNVLKEDLSGELHIDILLPKTSFIAYPFFKPSKEFVPYGFINILPAKDIAIMKVIAISQRGRKRDFVDLYWYCQNRERLYDIVLRTGTQYPGQGENINHILRSLNYFDDAEQDPMPKIFFKASWRGVKKYFQTEVPRITKEFLGIK